MLGLGAIFPLDFPPFSGRLWIQRPSSRTAFFLALRVQWEFPLLRSIPPLGGVSDSRFPQLFLSFAWKEQGCSASERVVAVLPFLSSRWLILAPVRVFFPSISPSYSFGCFFFLFRFFPPLRTFVIRGFTIGRFSCPPFLQPAPTFKDFPPRSPLTPAML